MTTLTTIHSIKADWISRTQRLSDLVTRAKLAPSYIEMTAIRNASQEVHQVVLQVMEILSKYENDIKSQNRVMIRTAALSTVDTLCFSFGALGLISSQDQETKHTYPWLEGVSIAALALSQIASKVNDYFHLKGMREEKQALQNVKTLEAILKDPMTEKIWKLFGVSQDDERINKILTEEEWKRKRDDFLSKEITNLSIQANEATPLLMD